MLKVLRIIERAGLGQAEPGLGQGPASIGLFAWRMYFTSVKILSHLSVADKCKGPLNVGMIGFYTGGVQAGLGRREGTGRVGKCGWGDREQLENN